MMLAASGQRSTVHPSCETSRATASSSKSISSQPTSRSSRQDATLPDWLSQFVPWVFTAIAGVYGFIKDRQARAASERSHRRVFLREQLDEFYAPALGKAEEIMALSKARVAYSEAMSEVFATGVPEDARGSVDDFIDHDNEQLRERILPLYREIGDLFRDKRAFIEPSTMEHQEALVTFLDVWDRYLTREMNFEVAKVLREQQRPLRPLFEDLAAHVDRIRTELQAN